MHNEKWHKSVAKSTKNAIKYRREMNKNRAILYMFIYIKRVQKLHYYQFYVPKNSKHKTDINANNKTNVITRHTKWIDITTLPEQLYNCRTFSTFSEIM